jgi:hypothetical protein
LGASVRVHVSGVEQLVREVPVADVLDALRRAERSPHSEGRTGYFRQPRDPLLEVSRSD